MLLLFSLLLFFPLEEIQSYPGCPCVGCCDELGINIYEELGCEGVIKDHHLCPDYYKCPDYKTGDDFCMFGGEIYQLGELVNGTSNCKICECKRTFIDGRISAGIQCHPRGGCHNFNRNGCRNVYALDKCCPTGSYCSVPGNDDFVCKVDGHCYKEGERFAPKDSCHECVCSKGFTGAYVEPYCRRRRCDVEAKFGEEIRGNCAPVYYKPERHEAMCCPHRFICPGDDCRVEKVNVGFPNCQTCYFGEEAVPKNASLYVHRELLGGTSSVLCTCKTPPLLTCVE